MIAAFLAGAYLAVLLVRAWLAIRSARLMPAATGADPSGVAIVQPILSGDPNLEDTLRDNVRALPAVRFIWLVDEDDRAGHELCVRLRDRHADLRIDVVTVTQPPPGVNPKAFKLERARHLAGDGVLLILDDDTRLPAQSLSALVSGLDRCALTTGLPGYLDDETWPSRLLAQFVNNNAALTFLPLVDVLPPVTINGMAYAMSSRTLDALGGFGPIMHAVTDDLALARQVLAGGGRICQTASPVWVQTSVGSAGRYARQMHRWFLFAWILVRRQPAARRTIILLLHATPPWLLWGVVIAAAWRPSAASLAALVVLLAWRAVMLIAIQKRIYGRALHRAVYSIVSELLQPVHTVHALAQRSIVWRTRRYRVHADGSFEVRS